MQAKRTKIEKENVFDLLGFLFKGLENEKGIPLENDATRDISSYFMRFLNGQDKGFLRKTCKTLREKGVMEIKKWKDKRKNTLCKYAAAHGFLFLLQWARKEGYFWDEWTCAYAAQTGHLNVLQWARAQVPPCPWDKLTCTKTAEKGHLNILQWARENGCPWDEWTCEGAARRGHFDVLHYAIENKCPGYEDYMNNTFE